MSEAAEKKIEELETEARVARELIFLLLDHLGGSVTLDLDDSREKVQAGGDAIVDMTFDYDAGTWKVQLVYVEQ